MFLLFIDYIIAINRMIVCMGWLILYITFKRTFYSTVTCLYGSLFMCKYVLSKQFRSSHNKNYSVC